MSTIPMIAELDRIPVQLYLAEIPMTWQRAQPALGKIILQIEALGAAVTRAHLSERLQRASILEIEAEREDGVIFDLHQDIAAGDHILIYARHGRIVGLVVVPDFFADLLREPAPSVRIPNMKELS